MSLYHDYRPESLEEIVGNQTVVASIQTMLQAPKKKRSHAYLLSGETGCGKTTIGRILAKEFGSSGFDLTELDSADERGIDGIRRIISQSQLRARESDAIVWIMDESHKLTGDAQSALLKILEDTPKHVYFILCTTDPQKLLAPIRSRCTHYEMKPLKEKEMMGLLRNVVKAEGVNISREVYHQIIQDCKGRARNALQVLEKVMSLDPEEQLQEASRAAENVSASIDLCRLLIKGSGWKRVAEVLKGLKDEQPESIRRHILGYAQSILLKGEDNKRCGLVMEEMVEPFYNSGYPGLVFACYTIICDNTPAVEDDLPF